MTNESKTAIRKAIDEMLAEGIGLHEAQKKIRQEYMRAALKLTEANQTKAALQLRVHRNTVYRMVHGQS